MPRLATVESIELVPPSSSGGHIALTGTADPATPKTTTAAAAAAGAAAATTSKTSLREIASRPHTAAAEAANVVSQQQRTSQRRRVAIATFVLLGNMVQMISNGATVTAGFKLGKELGVPDIRQSNWVAASYSLTQGTFVLVSGRLGSVYGHKNILLVGGFWFMLWSFINIACSSFMSFYIARGFTGIGGAFIAPNAVAMISITFPPGKMRNLCLGIFGAAAPIGGYLGAVFAGLFTQFTPWQYLFLFQGLLAAVVFSMLWWILPYEIPVDGKGKVDWIGAGLGMTGLILFNFTWNQAPAAGWSNPYQIGVLIASVVVLTLFALWESYSEAPIMPLSVWKAPSFLPLMLSVLMSFMSFGIMLWYMTAWLQLTREWSVLKFAAGWTPFLFFGIFSAWLASYLIPRMSAQYILAIGLLSVIISTILIATMPVQQSYWKQVFPATVLMSFCPDLVFTAAQIIASNALPRSQQGVAASLVGVLMLYGNSLGLGFAGTIETQVDKAKHADLTSGYRAALWFGCGIGLLALILNFCFVRMKKDDREGWDDEEDYLRASEQEGAVGTGTDLQQASRGV